MAALSAAQRNQIYNELAEVTSETTAEAIMSSVVDAPWQELVTNDHLDARLAEMRADFERSMRANTFRMLTVMFAFNGALVAAVAAIH